MAQKMIVFGDFGIDDTVALIYSHFDDMIDVVGVVANYGNVSRDKAMANASYMQQRYNMDQSVDVILGANIPMTGEKPASLSEIHGEYGLGPIKPPHAGEEAVTENFFDVVELIRRYQDEHLIIVNIGRLTSLAAMFILYPEEMKKIQAFYFMGGAFWVPGNVTAVSEANFHGDPIAARLVLNQAENVTIVPLDATRQAIVTPQMVDDIDRAGQAEIIKPLLDYYYDFYKQRDPWILGAPQHDVATVMATVYKTMFTFRYLPVKIVENDQGVDRGQSIADIRPYVDVIEKEAKEEKHYRIALDIDYWQFYHQFMAIMTGERFR
ncbi:nucleoside hydrolase [Barrientosiimonas marina]|uniref:Nucleoside hydrolase n=1 Tax=Lentibacillus kimchii TaxID=1542911 RepID=A0ABW2UQS9_9BACI